MDVSRYRQEFPITNQFIYFNHAAVAPANLLAQNRLAEYLIDARLGTVNEGKWLECIDQVRAAAACLVGARASEIAFVQNASTGAAMMANGIQWQAQDNIVVPYNQFPANVYPWLNLRNRGVAVRAIELPHTESWFEVLQSHIDNNTRLIAISYVEFSDGFRYDLKRLGEFCQQRNILLFVDAIQGVGALRFDVREARIDFMAVSGHKWLLGPIGQGFMFIAEERMDSLYVTTQSWLSVENPWDFYNYTQPFKSGAARFEGGTSNMIGILWLGASLNLILEIGIQAIEERILTLTDDLIAGVSKKGYLIASNLNRIYRSGIVSFRHPRIPSRDLLADITQKRMVISEREGNLRVSPHFYNTESEIEEFVKALP